MQPRGEKAYSFLLMLPNKLLLSTALTAALPYCKVLSISTIGLVGFAKDFVINCKQAKKNMKCSEQSPLWMRGIKTVHDVFKRDTAKDSAVTKKEIGESDKKLK